MTFNLESALHKECTAPLSTSIFPTWREKVTQWYYDVVDHLEEDRSIVYISMNILDQYCAWLTKNSQNINERNYEVASMTALFLAIRIAGYGNLQLPELALMSWLGMRIQDMVSMGNKMIEILSWDNHIIMPYDFLAAFLKLVSLLNETRRRHVQDMACYLVEISVFDIAVSMDKASEVAVAAILNSMTKSEATVCAEALQQATGVSTELNTINKISAQLQGMYSQNENDRHSSCGVAVEEDSRLEEQVYPRVVSVEDLDLVAQDDTSSIGLKRSHSTYFPQDDQPQKRSKHNNDDNV